MLNEGERATRSRAEVSPEKVPLENEPELLFLCGKAPVVVVVLHRRFEFNDYIWLVAFFSS